MERRFLGYIVVRHRAVILELLAGKDESLLIRRDAFLLKDFILNTRDGVRTLYFNGYSFTSKSFHEDLHLIG
jgi:hypothetical protein